MVPEHVRRSSCARGLGIAACVVAAGIEGRAQRGGGAPAGPQVTQRRARSCGSAMSDRSRRAASPRSRACPAIPRRITSARRRAACGRSTDSGQTWAPIFDEQPVQAIGSLAVAPSDPNQVWAGTGEAWVIRDSDIGGDGIYKSTDAGKTWKNMGLPETGRIGTHHRPSDQSEHRLRLRDRPRHRTAAGARRVSRRPTAARRGSESLFVDPEHGLLGHLDGSEESRRAASPACGRSRCTRGRCSAAGRAAACYVTHDGGKTWTKLDDRHAALAGRQDRRRDRAVESEADVRADSDREPGLALAIGRRRRDVEGRELGSHAHRPRRLLHPHRGQSAESGRRVHPEQRLPSIERRRRRRLAAAAAAAAAAATATTSGSIRRTAGASC